MSRKKPPYARIAITLPPRVLAAADRLARRLDRSRSWVIAEAIRQLDARPEAQVAGRVREPATAYPEGPEPGLGTHRLGQLEADLRLGPERRVLAAEETARLGRLVQAGVGEQLLLFDRPEDYLLWKQRDRVGA